MKKHPKQIKDIVCHNCNHPLQGDENFCPNCGQKNNIRPLSVKMFFSSFFSNFFNFDNRIWHTIITLIRYPGKTAQEYVSGKRARYSNPFKFLLQVSIVFFLLSGMVEFFYKDTSAKKKFITIKESSKNTANAVKELTDTYERKLDSIEQDKKLLHLLNNPELSALTKDSIAGIFQEGIKLKFGFQVKKANFEYEAPLKGDIFQEYLTRKGVKYTYYPRIYDKEAFESKAWYDKLSILWGIVYNKVYQDKEVGEILSQIQIEPNLKNRFLLRIAKRLSGFFNSSKSREEIKKSIVSKISFGLFFILPLLALFVKLLYYKSKYTYTETLVLIFYLQSVYFLVLGAELFVDLIPIDILTLFTFLFEVWFVYYLYRSFLKFFGQKKWMTVIKTLFLIIPVYMILSGVGFVIITFLTIVIS